jgi:NADH:ubiquinone oxidoreductase subunit 4 (subunit M)
MLWLVRRLFYGPEQPRWVGHLTDMTGTERFVGAVLCAGIVVLGVYPLSLTHLYTNVADQMAKQAATHVVALEPDMVH